VSNAVDVLLATDADWIFDEVAAAIAGDGTRVNRVRAGSDVRAAVAELEPDLVVLDLQIGNMGGVAASIDLRHEAGAERLPATRILLLLDREADTWLAEEAQADGWLIKPLDAFRLRRAAKALLACESWHEGLGRGAHTP
jgi:DNA-binding response OmpR family regulator